MMASTRTFISEGYVALQPGDSPWCPWVPDVARLGKAGMTPATAGPSADVVPWKGTWRVSCASSAYSTIGGYYQERARVLLGVLPRHRA